eukprot:jgi/Bigna1/67779/fgenesh1_pg.4_\
MVVLFCSNLGWATLNRTRRLKKIKGSTSSRMVSYGMDGASRDVEYKMRLCIFEHHTTLRNNGSTLKVRDLMRQTTSHPVPTLGLTMILLFPSRGCFKVASSYGGLWGGMKGTKIVSENSLSCSETAIITAALSRSINKTQLRRPHFSKVLLLFIVAPAIPPKTVPDHTSPGRLTPRGVGAAAAVAAYSKATTSRKKERYPAWGTFCTYFDQQDEFRIMETGWTSTRLFLTAMSLSTLFQTTSYITVIFAMEKDEDDGLTYHRYRGISRIHFGDGSDNVIPLFVPDPQIGGGEDGKGDDTATIAGAVVGGLIGVVIIVLALCYFHRWRLAKERMRDNEEYAANNTRGRRADIRIVAFAKGLWQPISGQLTDDISYIATDEVGSGRATPILTSKPSLPPRKTTALKKGDVKTPPIPERRRRTGGTPNEAVAAAAHLRPSVSIGLEEEV